MYDDVQINLAAVIVFDGVGFDAGCMSVGAMIKCHGCTWPSNCVFTTTMRHAFLKSWEIITSLDGSAQMLMCSSLPQVEATQGIVGRCLREWGSEDVAQC